MSSLDQSTSRVVNGHHPTSSEPQLISHPNIVSSPATLDDRPSKSEQRDLCGQLITCRPPPDPAHLRRPVIMLQQRIRRSRSPPRPPEATPTLALNPLILCYLILALLAASTSAQNTSVTLPLRPTTYPLSQLASTPLVLSLAPLSTPETVYLSLSLCTDSSPPLVVLTTSEEIDVPTSATDLSAKGGSVPKSAVWRVDWDQGFASWNGTVGAGGMRVALESAEDGTGGEVEISMAGTGESRWVSPRRPVRRYVRRSSVALFRLPLSPPAPIQTVATTVPVLGDTTSSHLLLFTPTFLAPPPDQASPQTYPNYQIPPPVFNVTPPSATPNHTLFIFPSSFTDDGLARSSCAVKKRAGRVNGTTVVDREMRLVKGKGWREMLVLDGSTGLDPGGNYTVWIERTDAGGGATQWSGPLWFKMKPGSSPPHDTHSTFSTLTPTSSYDPPSRFSLSPRLLPPPLLPLDRLRRRPPLFHLRHHHLPHLPLQPLLHYRLLPLLLRHNPIHLRLRAGHLLSRLLMRGLLRCLSGVGVSASDPAGTLRCATFPPPPSTLQWIR